MPMIRQNPARPRNKMPFLKKLFWAYFLLLIFEGALRKWIVPQLSAPLLLVRDPIGLLILLEALRTQTQDSLPASIDTPPYLLSTIIQPGFQSLP